MARNGSYSEHYSKIKFESASFIKYQYIKMETLTLTNPFSILSRREREVLNLILQGTQVKDISATLELKSNTISTFKKNILSKVGVSNNIELFKLAQEYKII
jgi:two-component system uhpT operon response regulator UhpA